MYWINVFKPTENEGIFLQVNSAWCNFRIYLFAPQVDESPPCLVKQPTGPQVEDLLKTDQKVDRTVGSWQRIMPGLVDSAWWDVSKAQCSSLSLTPDQNMSCGTRGDRDRRKPEIHGHMDFNCEIDFFHYAPLEGRIGVISERIWWPCSSRYACLWDTVAPS